MNQFRSWFHTFDQKHFNINKTNTVDQSFSSNIDSTSGILHTLPNEVDIKMKMVSNEKNHQENFNSIEKINKLDSNRFTFKKAMQKYIPLEPGDCLECKLIGTGVMTLCGFIIMSSALKARKSNPKIKGINGIVYTLICSSLFVGFQTAAYCRLFDKGIFSKTN